MPNPFGRAGSISAFEALTLPEFRARFNLGAAAMRKARRDGLQVRQLGRNKYVLGKDVIEFLERVGQ